MTSRTAEKRTKAVDRSQRPLSEVARHVIIPTGIVDTLWFEVEERCAEFGDEFDAWQDGLGQVALGLRADGTFAATEGGVTISIPRQVAKTFIVMRIVVALCTLYPNLTVVWTAHHLRTSTMTFQKMKTFAMSKGVRPYIANGTNQGTGIRDANGEQEIPFVNSSRIMFGSRKMGFGRGFDEIDVEVFDEAQILTDQALDDMVPATNQSRFQFGALLFYMGTPPRPNDSGEVFTSRRDEALAIKGDGEHFGPPVVGGDAVYIECSADGDANPEDREQWAKANPSYPHRTPWRSIQRMRKNLRNVKSQLREGLGVWDPKIEDSPFKIDPACWDAMAVSADRIEYDHSTARLSLAVAWDRSWSSIAVVGTNPQGFAQAKIIASKVGTQWAPARLHELWVELGNRQPVLMSAGESLIDDVETLGVEVTEVKPGELASATQKLLDAVRADAPQLKHAGETNLATAASMVAIRPYGNTGITMSDRHSDGDISPLKALTLAYGALMSGEVALGNPLDQLR